VKVQSLPIGVEIQFVSIIETKKMLVVQLCFEVKIFDCGCTKSLLSSCIHLHPVLHKLTKRSCLIVGVTKLTEISITTIKTQRIHRNILLQQEGFRQSPTTTTPIAVVEDEMM